MTSHELSHLTGLANQIGKPAGVVCRYEWESRDQTFKWNFYRHGHWIGSTGNPKDVVKRATNYATVK